MLEEVFYPYSLIFFDAAGPSETEAFFISGFLEAIG